MNAKEIIRKHYQKIGAKGGLAGTGKAKARSSVAARKAANARWKANKKSRQTDTRHE